jgi:hypothetical protein
LREIGTFSRFPGSDNPFDFTQDPMKEQHPIFAGEIHPIFDALTKVWMTQLLDDSALG